MKRRDTIVRYTAPERINHWITAFCFILAAVSGLGFLFPSFNWLMQIMGTPQLARILHPFVGVVQHVHHVRTANPGRIVQARVIVTTGFQLAHALCRQRFHILFRAKVDSAGWAGLHAGRFLPNHHAVNAQRTFVDAVVFRVEARNVERTARNAITAANALLGLEVDDTVGILNNCTFRRARFQAAWIGTVHTAVFAD